jgi:malonyl-CoA O-methyltransferase
MNMLRRIWHRLTHPRRPGSCEELSSLEAYALWADSYPAQAHNRLMHIEETAMRDCLPDLHNQRVLDAACGSGRYAAIAQEHGAASVIALDNSLAMLQQAHISHRICAPLDALPLASQSVDVILCGLALGHLPELTPVLNEFGRVLVPGGTALISDFHPFQALNGAQRTFTINGITHAVEHYPHLYADYHQAATSAGLFVDTVQEPSITRNGQTLPVVLVLQLKKVSALSYTS